MYADAHTDRNAIAPALRVVFVEEEERVRGERRRGGEEGSDRHGAH